MVHTRAVQSVQDAVQMAQLECVAMSTEPHFAFLRPRHAQHPHRAERFFLRKQRAILATPAVVARLAVADDADPFTNLSLGSEHRYLRGRWVDGTWIDEQASCTPENRRVPEGRVLGYSIWRRHWPASPEAAVRAKAAAPGIWPLDNLWKQTNRVLSEVMDWFGAITSPDPSENPDHILEFVLGTEAQYLDHLKAVSGSFDHDGGYIYCFSVVVDPSFQRRGIGARLMKWGIERAEKENVPIILNSTLTGVALYEKLGFQTLGTISIDNGNVREKTMIYWPKSGASAHE